MNEELISQRLAHLFPWPFEGDRILLERMWTKLDWALENCRLQVHDEVMDGRALRVVTALDLFRIYVDPEACELMAFAIEESGFIRRIDSGFHAVRLFDLPRCRSWWLRYAFQRWERRQSWLDFIADPHTRPSNVELKTSKVLIDRLQMDSRYQTLAVEFDAATGIPESVITLMAEVMEAESCNIDRANDIWGASQCAMIAMRRAMALTQV